MQKKIEVSRREWLKKRGKLGRVARRKSPAEALRETLRAGARQMPFRPLVFRSLRRIPINTQFSAQNVYRMVFTLLKKCEQKNPAVMYMNVHHEYLQRRGEAATAKWDSVSWGRLERSADPKRRESMEKEKGLRLIFQEIASRTGDVLRHLESNNFIERVPHTHSIFRLINYPPLEAL